jgi:hypothetical protein
LSVEQFGKSGDIYTGRWDKVTCPECRKQGHKADPLSPKTETAGQTSLPGLATEPPKSLL